MGEQQHSVTSGIGGGKSATKALKEIYESIVPFGMSPVTIEQVRLEDSVGRVLAEDLYACFDTPLFDESTRDGYAIGALAPEKISKRCTFSLVGTSGAGDALDITLGEGEVWRVMTGGKVPENCSRVIPQECCQLEGDCVVVEGEKLKDSAFIRRKGDMLGKGSQLLSKNEVVTPANLIRIANGGHGEVKVYPLPKTCFCCTGKELVIAGKVPEGAQKISSNQYLLHALFQQYSCDSANYGIVGDEEQLVVDFFTHSLDGKYDLVLTTGGTGDGDFDLVERSFVKAGGTVVCNSIDMRPGKSIVAGVKGRTVYIGLPGPPAAVHTVFLEIVAPIVRKISGMKSDCNTVLSAVAGENIHVKSRDELVIKEGVICSVDGALVVYKAGKKDFASCNILVPPGKTYLSKGEVVEIHMREPLY